jgi:hypothetical protein
MLAGVDGVDDNHRFKSFTQVALSAAITISLLASMFGAIQCISWSFTFPSPALRTIWRTCSMYITYYPLSLTLYPALQILDDCVSLRSVLVSVVRALVPIVLFILSPLYIVARIIILLVAVTSPVPF